MLLFDSCLEHLPGANEATEAREEVQFEISGLSNLCQNLTAAAESSTTPAKLLDKDLELYEVRAKEHCIKTMQEAAATLPSGSSKAKIDPPDPLFFWNVQVR